jgi:site-specific DNA-methyltransferase (adenine-specific)
LFIDVVPNALIALGDCIENLKNIEDCTVDCVITDPPYFLEGMDDKWNVEELNKKKSKSGVIKALPTGMKFDARQGIRLQNFMEEVSKEIIRVLKPGGFFICFSQGRLYHRMAIGLENSGFEIRDMFIWKRESQAKAFSQNHFIRKMNISEEEKLRIISRLNNRKTPQLKSQSEPMVLAQKPREGTFVKNWIKWETGLIDISQSLDGKFPGTIMQVDKPRGQERKFEHMTLKPIALLKHLVNVFTIENQVVLDPFMGSGTTGIACLQTGRKFIGIELNEKYYDMSQSRLKQQLENVELKICQ